MLCGILTMDLPAWQSEITYLKVEKHLQKLERIRKLENLILTKIENFFLNLKILMNISLSQN